ncbi:hypothetical protein IEQ34_020673 [Dendrobium chrysotoxum]|uniref:Uncharacterized protein n=1 Tax=Dendrobium chrysotoxum TaxID=161865 RepID=A0AAV7G133_DENCH|nr:hypothetical protein IEQ34_020673 [Dendrobium chrysotoxum]
MVPAAKERHPAQATALTWRPARKLAPCTRSSHAEQRNAASASQYTDASPLQSSHSRRTSLFIFLKP